MPIIIGGNSGGKGSLEPNDNLPEQITWLKYEHTSTTLTLYWKNPTEYFSGVVLVRNTHVPENMKDGIEVYNGGSTQFTDTGLTDNTFYTYRAFPYNEKGQYQTQLNTFICQTYEGKILTIGRHIGDSNPANMWYAEDAITMSPSLGNNGNFIDNGWSNVWPFNEIKPCLLKDGFVVGYLNPNDFTKFEDGTAADIISGNAGDVMIEFPKMGMRILRDSINEFYQITNVERLINGEFKPYAFTRNTIGDCDKLYVGVCNGYVANGKLRSLASKTPSGKVTMSQFRSYAKANGDYYDIVSFYPWTLLQMLYLIRYRNLNSQLALGNGNSNNSVILSTGNSLSMKMNYGVYGNNGNISNQPVTCNGIENMWGNVFQFIDGVKVDANYNILTSYTNFTDDSSYVNVGKTSLMNLTYISNIFDSNNNITLKGFFPTEANGTETTFYCDDAKIESSKGCIRVGGQYITGSSDGAGPRNGAFRMITDNVSSNGTNLNARLMYLAPSDHVNRVARITNFSAVPDNNQIILSLNLPNNDSLNRATTPFAGAKIVRSTTGIPTTHDASASGEKIVYTISSSSSSQVKFVDTDVVNGTTYYYRVFCFNGGGEYHYGMDGMCCSISPKEFVTYTIKIDRTDTNPATCVTYHDDVANAIPQRMEYGTYKNKYGPDWDEFPIFKDIKPCLLKNGEVVGYLQKNDFSKFEDGSAADITSGNAGDVMIEFPRILVRSVIEGNYNVVSITNDMSKYVASGEWEDVFFSYPNTFDSSKVYIGAYPSTIDKVNKKIRSLAGLDLTMGTDNVIAINEINEYARNVADSDENRVNYSGMDYCRLSMLQLLYLFRFKNLNLREVIFKTGDDYGETYVTGSFNKAGMTSLQNRAGINRVPITKMFGIEHMTGPLEEQIIGLYTDANFKLWWESCGNRESNTYKYNILNITKDKAFEFVNGKFWNKSYFLFIPAHYFYNIDANINKMYSSRCSYAPSSATYFGKTGTFDDGIENELGMFTLNISAKEDELVANRYPRLMYVAVKKAVFKEITPVFTNELTAYVTLSTNDCDELQLIRNTEHIPTSPSDGEIIDSKYMLKNNDEAAYFMYDKTIVAGVKYYYRIFAFANNRSYTMSEPFDGMFTYSTGGVNITRDDSTFKLNIAPTGVYTSISDSIGTFLNIQSKFPYSKMNMCCINNGKIKYKYNDGFTNTSAIWSDGTPIGANEYTTSGNWMIEIPVFGYRINKNGGTISVEITEDQNANEADGWSYDAFRTEPNGPKKKLYVGEFLSTNVGGVLKSYPNSVPFQGDSANLETCYNMAVANGSGWSLINYHTITIFQILYLVAYRNGDCQSRFGNGIVDMNTFSNTGLPNKFMYCDSNPGNNVRVKFLGLEDCWGNLNQWVLGAYVKSDGLYTGFNFSKTGEGYTKQVSFTPGRDGTAKDIVGTTSAGFYPSEIIQFNENRYYCDRIFDYNNSGMTWGGPYNCLKEAGIFFMSADQDVNYGGKTFGARLIYHAP